MGLQETLFAADALFQRIAGPLNNIVLALVILLFGFIIGKVLDRVLRRLFADTRLDERLARLRGVQRNYSRALRHAIIRLVYLCTILLALHRLSLLRTTGYALLVVVVIALLISSILWLRDLFPNLAGRFALRRRPFGVGDEITVVGKNGVLTGTVQRISPLQTRIVRQNGDVFFIPNATLAAERIVKRRPRLT